MKKSTNKEVSVLITGDFCPMYKLQDHLAKGNLEYVYGDFLDNIRQADISILNLEAPITLKRKGILKRGPHLKLKPAIAKSISDAGFEVTCLANNHILDYGEDGLKDTLFHLGKNKIKYFGVVENNIHSQEPLIIRKKGLKIALIAFAENEFSSAGENSWGACPLDPLENFKAIKKASQKADVVLVFVHGGNEFCPIPSARITKRYRGFVEAGASAVIASHTHVPQGYEVYKGKPIFYSLGNFMFPWVPIKKEELWYKGIVPKLIITKSGVEISSVTPVVSDKKTGVLTLQKKEETRKFKDYIKHLSVLLENDNEMKKLWQAWCLMKAPEIWVEPMRSLKWPLKSKKDYGSYLAAENRIKCEAHKDLSLGFLELIREGKLDHAKEYIPKIEKLIKGDTNNLEKI